MCKGPNNPKGFSYTLKVLYSTNYTRNVSYENKPLNKQKIIRLNCLAFLEGKMKSPFRLKGLQRIWEWLVALQPCHTIGPGIISENFSGTVTHVVAGLPAPVQEARGHVQRRPAESHLWQHRGHLPLPDGLRQRPGETVQHGGPAPLWNRTMLFRTCEFK